MSYYIRVGNQSLKREEFEHLKPAQVEKIKKDAIRADQIRKDNIAASLGLKKEAVSFTPDIRPGSDLSKAIADDKASAALKEASDEFKKKVSLKKTKTVEEK